MPRLVLALTLVSLVGCGRARLVDDPLPDASGRPDAGGLDAPSFDVASFDVPRVDAGPQDAGNDAGPVTDLQNALTCGLDQNGAIRAALRTAECDGIPFSQTYEAYEAFLFARSAFHLSGLPEGNCEYWRCVSNADNCADYNSCFEASICPGGVEPFCEGELAVSCGAHPVTQVIDCASFGGECQSGTCVFEEAGCSSSFTSDSDLRCRDGQLSLCSGESISCLGLSDFGCNRVVVQGEIPVAWCGRATAGLFGTPNDCLSETRLSFVSESGAVVEFECPDFGYRFCSESGCTSL